MDTGYQLAFWLVTAIFGIAVVVAGSMFTRWANRIDENFRELFAKLDYMAEQKEVDKLVKDVSDMHDEIIVLKTKVNNCKACNQ